MDRHLPDQVLGVPSGATEKEIWNAYRRLAMKYHPDRNPGDPEAEEKFKEVQWAYETLTGKSETRGPDDLVSTRWGFEAPFSDSSDPFFSFSMAMRKYFRMDQGGQPSSKKKRGPGKKR